MADKIPNPRRAEWELSFSKCRECPIEPHTGTQEQKKQWRNTVYSHGHGFPPGFNLWKTSDGVNHRNAKSAREHEARNGLNQPPLSQAQGATKKMTPAAKNKLLSWEHFDYLPEATKKEVLGDKYKGDLE